MINLIPPQGQTALKHEYILRVWTMYAVILTGIFLAGAALLIPTYTLVSTQLRGVEIDTSKLSEINGEYTQAEEDISHANNVIAQLKANTYPVRVSEIIEEIVSRGAPHIVFTTFQTSETKGVLDGIAVQGIAPSRGALAAFKTALETSPHFKTVKLPISDLAKDADLPFAITLTLAPEATQ